MISPSGREDRCFFSSPEGWRKRCEPASTGSQSHTTHDVILEADDPSIDTHGVSLNGGTTGHNTRYQGRFGTDENHIDRPGSNPSPTAQSCWQPGVGTLLPRSHMNLHEFIINHLAHLPTSPLPLPLSGYFLFLYSFPFVPDLRSSQEELTIKIAMGKFPPVDGRYSRNVRSLVGKMLAMNPRRRPSTQKVCLGSHVVAGNHRGIHKAL